MSHPLEAEYSDAYGFTPLHFASLRGAPVDLIKSLIDEFPEACVQRNKYGKLPLHLCCKCTDLSSVHTLYGLLFSVNRLRSTVFICETLEKKTPLEILCHWNSRTIQEVLNEPSPKQQRHLAWDEQFRVFWIKACMLLHAATHTEAPASDPTLVDVWQLEDAFEQKVVHACVATLCHPLVRCPSCLFLLAVRLYPDQLIKLFCARA